MPQYIINKGDTLSGIAQKFGYGGDYMSLARANNIANPNVIQAGATLNIPDRAAPGAAPASVPAPVQQPTQPVVSQPQIQSTGGGWQSLPGYAGWDPVAAEADFKATGGAGKGAPGGSGMVPNISQPQVPQFQPMYDKWITEGTAPYQPLVTQAQVEMDTIQKEIDTRTTALNTALGKINDNPYYSEATRVGRAAKLQEAYNNDVRAISGRLTVAQNKKIDAENRIQQVKADAQVKLNIASNQYNIENTQYQQQLQQINSYLSAGMFNNASGADIAQIATMTGMNTSMIQSIIDASKKSKEVKPELKTADDGTNQYVVAIDPMTGNVINKQIISSSKPKATGSGSSMTNIKSNAAQALQAVAGQDGKVSEEEYLAKRAMWVSMGYSAADFDQQFSSFVNPQYWQSYQIVNPSVIKMFRGGGDDETEEDFEKFVNG